MTQQSDPESISLIEDLLSTELLEKKAFLWDEISYAMSNISQTHTEEAEALMLRILEFEGAIPLAPESGLPGVMSPEDMLKSTAIHVLSKWTGRKHLKMFQRIRETTQSDSLSEQVEIVIKKLYPTRIDRPPPTLRWRDD